MSDDRAENAWDEVRNNLVRWLRGRATENERVAALGGQDDPEIQRLLAEMGSPTYAQQAVAERALAAQIAALAAPEATS